MNQKTAGWIIFIGAVGMMCSLLAVDVAKLVTWNEAVRPTFVAVVMAHLGTVILAFIGGKIIPEDRQPNMRTRQDDPPPPLP